MLACGLRRLHYLSLGAVLATVLVASCFVGVQARRIEPPTGDFCPARWLAEDDPAFEQAREAMEELRAELPEEATALLPDRAARFSSECPLRFRFEVRGGSCYLFAAQVIPRSGRPRATLELPDPLFDQPRARQLDHSMTATFGDGADPLCYEDSFSGVVRLIPATAGDAMWAQVYEMTPTTAEEWSARRREELAAEARRQAEEAAARQELVARCQAWVHAREAVDADVEAGAEQSADAGVDAAVPAPPEGCTEAMLSTGPILWDGGPPDAGVDASPVDEEPPPPVPEGPLAIESLAQCRDGEDNDEDGAADCEDIDCLQRCPDARLERAPWPRVLDARLGLAYRVAHEGMEPDEPFNPEFAPLQADWGLAGEVSGVWRLNRYLGLGFDFGVSHLSMSSFDSLGSEGRQNRIGVTSVILGLSLSASIPVWIMEIGGSVGLGWLLLSTKAEERSYEGGVSSWQENEDYARTYNYAYGSGRIWVDFWLVDSFALGLYGGLLVPLHETRRLVTNDYHVGLRTTLRFGL